MPSGVTRIAVTTYDRFLSYFAIAGVTGYPCFLLLIYRISTFVPEASIRIRDESSNIGFEPRKAWLGGMQ